MQRHNIIWWSLLVSKMIADRILIRHGDTMKFKKFFKNSLINIYVLYGTTYRIYCSLHSCTALRLRGVEVGKKLSVRGKLNLHISPNSKVKIGTNVRMKSGFGENAVGGALRIGFWVNRGGSLTICDGVGISNSTIVCSNSIVIGEKTFIGGGTNIYDTDFHSIDPQIRVYGHDDAVKTAPIVIGKEVFIGGHCIILKGITIGDQAVIGAGSVVTKDITPRQIWAGNPVRFIKEL